MYFLLSLNLLMISFFLFNLSMIFLIKNLIFIMSWLIYNYNFLMIKFICYLDWMSLMFISLIFLISSMVILYSIEYMNMDLNMNRFMILIMIFVLSMVMMIISMNLMTILLGWDGLGLSSYCLVIYYQNNKSYNSGMITILMNRIGDIMILMSISIMMMFGSWNFLLLNNIKDNFILMMLVFVASITKSAQIPFSTWLPLAMAAPTPVSSLVHSSTLVTAGIYLLIRFSSLISNNFLFIMMLISLFTMFFSGVSANFEFDLKKIIALSTLSQLGLMLFILSFKLMYLSFFHLISHAMFKSLLFLCSGIMIHNYFNNQDIRFISMNLNYMPYINYIFYMSSMTLCGLPFLTGFFSKDFIIEMFNMKMNNLFIFMIMYISMGMTICYSFRLIYYLNIKIVKIIYYNKMNLFSLMNISLLILIFFTLFFGSMMNWLIFNFLNYIYLNFKLKLMIFLFMFLGILLSLCLIKFNFFKYMYMNFMFKIFNNMFFVPNNFKKIKINYLNLNNKMLMIQDYGWNEFLLLSKLIYFLNLNNYLFMKNKLMFMFLYLLFIYLLIMNLI